MKDILCLALVLMGLGDPITNIATINRLKEAAQAAFEQDDYEQAAQHYAALVDSLGVEDEGARLNLAHARLMMGDTAAAQLNYTRLSTSEDRQIKSVAHQQVGVILSDQQKYEEALTVFKESLKADPTNEETRYNYELVKELLKQKQQEQEQQEQSEQNDEQQEQQDQQQDGEQDQSQQQDGEQQESEESGEQSEEQSGEQQEQSQSEQEGEEGEESEESEGEQETPSSVADKLKEMNISEEKAQMILEAMRNNEMQYIQQNRRKPQKPRDRTKPDW